MVARAARRTIGPLARLSFVDGPPTVRTAPSPCPHRSSTSWSSDPGRRSGRPSTTRPTGSCIRSISMSRAASTMRSSTLLASLGPRVHLLDVEIDSPDLVYTFDPLLVTDRGAIPLRPGKPNRAPEPAAIEAWTRRPASRRSAGSRRPGRSRAATRSGCGRTCSASAGRFGPTPTGARSSPRWSVATSGSSTCRTGADRPS